MEQIYSFEPVNNHKQSKSVSFCVCGAHIPTDPSLVNELHQISEKNPGKNIRFLFHSSPDSPLHIMLIKESRGFYYPTHVHKRRHEMHYLIEGIMGLYVLYPDGRKKQSLISTVTNPGLTSVDPGIPHVTIPISESVVYLEVKNGPSVDFADECFISDLEKKIGSVQYQEYLASSVY